ncbi:hypothetical protein QQG55_39325 [Brugia pahangi]
MAAIYRCSTVLPIMAGLAPSNQLRYRSFSHTLLPIPVSVCTSRAEGPLQMQIGRSECDSRVSPIELLVYHENIIILKRRNDCEKQ